MTSSDCTPPNLGDRQTKYSDRNPIVRYANLQFFRAIQEMLAQLPSGYLLDAGCGEGVVLSNLKTDVNERAAGLDLDPARVRLAQTALPGVDLLIADLHRLPLAKNAFDIVLMLEVLEHLPHPEVALEQAHRVCRRFLLASVPNEPWWRIGNMIRLKYLGQWGNTPEHIQHWSVRGFRNFIAGRFNVLEVRTPFLWTFILAEKA